MEAVGDLLGGLLNTPCDVGVSDEPLGIHASAPAIVTDYVNADGTLAGVVLLDLALAQRTSAALVSAAPASADAAIEAGTWDADSQDSYREVATVLSRLLGPSVRLSRVYNPGDLLPGSCRMIIQRKVGRLDAAVDVPGYGSGRMCLVMA